MLNKIHKTRQDDFRVGRASEDYAKHYISYVHYPTGVPMYDQNQQEKLPTNGQSVKRDAAGNMVGASTPVGILKKSSSLTGSHSDRSGVNVSGASTPSIVARSPILK